MRKGQTAITAQTAWTQISAQSAKSMSNQSKLTCPHSHDSLLTLTSSLEMDMSNMLIPEMPLSYSPSLAIELGSTEAAVFLQQLHFWLTVSQHHHDGKTWAYNTQDQCVALMRGTVSKSTVKRIVKGLRDRELIITMSLHSNKWNHTNFFTINYEKLGSLGLNYTANAYVPDWLKMNQSSGSDCTNRVDQIEPIDKVNVSQS